MKSLNQKQSIIFAGLLGGLLILVLLVLLSQMPENAPKKEARSAAPRFSQESGFYNEMLTLYLTADDGWDIYYTLDGSLPLPSNTASLLYDDSGIQLFGDDTELVYTVRAVSAKGESLSKVKTNTYILGDRVSERYELPVLAIAGDPEDLFGAATGIFLQDNRSQRGAASERAVHATLFDATGQVNLSQNCGIRIFGGVSRGKNQPSFRLYARSEYDSKNTFDFMFFDDEYTIENALVPKFKRIIARNGGDDNGYAYLRSELALRLSRDAGFLDTQCASPVCVYINGEYYGVYWFVTSYDDHYFVNKYGPSDGKMAVLEGSIHRMKPLETDAPEILREKEDYNQFHAYAAHADLSSDEEWQKVNDLVDVENFLQYAAIQHYVNNNDSYTNNFKAYRYYSPSDTYQPGTVFDGRYRFLLYDLDHAFGYDRYEDQLCNLTGSEHLAIEEEWYQLFRNLLSRPEAREYYIRYYLSLLNYYFSPMEAIPVLDEMHESHAEELMFLYNETDLLEGNILMPENVDYEHALSEIANIRNYLNARPEYGLEDLKKSFGLQETYELLVTNRNNAAVSVDFAKFHDNNYSGLYFKEIPVRIHAVPKCGYRLDHWVVNGEEISAEELTLTAEMIQEEMISVECICVAVQQAELLISAFNNKGTNDYIILTNWGQEPADLLRYIIADSDDCLKGSTLPKLQVAPGESITLYCKNYIKADSLGKPTVNFNLKEGEKLCLFQSDGKLLQEVKVPALGSRQSLYQMDMYNREFREVMTSGS